MLGLNGGKGSGSNLVIVIDDHVHVVTTNKGKKDRPLTILVVLWWHKYVEEAMTAGGNEEGARRW